MRKTPGKIYFNRFLPNVGSCLANAVGSCLANALDTDFIQIPKEMLCSGDLMERTCEPNIVNLSWQEIKKKGTICSKNIHCLEINYKIIQQLHGYEMMYRSRDSMLNDEESERMRYPLDFAHLVEIRSLPLLYSSL